MRIRCEPVSLAGQAGAVRYDVAVPWGTITVAGPAWQLFWHLLISIAIAENQDALRERRELSGGTSLLVYPVREHYIVYESLAERFIAVVAVIRQGRDVPAILQRWSAPIRRELIEIRARIERGEITWPTQSAARPRR